MATLEMILSEIDATWRGLRDALARVPPGRIDDGGAVGPWSLRDLIGHVTTWEFEAMESLRRYQDHDDLEMLAWPDVDSFNERTVDNKRAISLDELRIEFTRTHEELLRFIGDIPEKTLQVPEVERRIRVDTFEHYAEHTRDLERWLGEPVSRPGPR